MNITSAQLSSSHACNICNIEFDLRFDLRSHTQQQHNQKALQVPVVKKEEEVVKKLKQEKVEGQMPVLKKDKKIPAVKVVKKVKKEAFLTVKEEVAPVTKKEEKEVPMEQDTITSSLKFDKKNSFAFGGKIYHHHHHIQQSSPTIHKHSPCC